MKCLPCFVACVLLVSLGACATVSENFSGEELIEPNDQRLLIENRITQEIISDPLFAVQLVEYYRQEGALFLPTELDVFRTSLERKLNQQLSIHLRKENFTDALALFRSLQRAGYPVYPSLSLDQVLGAEVSWQLEQDDYLPLLFNASHISNYYVLSEEEISAVLKIALRHNHRILIQKIVDSISDMYVSLAQQYRAELQHLEFDFADMLDGMVTVWVDKGFAIEDGIGYPDRVFGSGFFVDQRGYLITNYHVIASEVDPEYEGFSRLYVRLSDNGDLRIPAKVVGYDRLLDIALVKTEVTPNFIFPLEMYQNPYRSGTQTYALGSPVGLDKTITSGIISSSSRRFLPIGETLQIDASVNPGNSGGPLVNNMSQLMGVVYAGIPQFQGINFAIPINWVWNRIPSLFAQENNRHFWLGVAVREMHNGLEVTYVMPGSSADEANINVGDILVRINGQSVDKIHVVQAILATFHAEALVQTDWVIGNNMRTYLMKIQPRPFSPIEEAFDLKQREELLAPLFGMSVERLGRRLRSRQYVVKDVYSGTIADELGFSPTDPFTLLFLNVDKKQRVAQMQINIRKTQNGFIASGLQLSSGIDLPNFI